MTRDNADFIASISGNFADALNEAAGDGLFSGQDGYEVLASVFGADLDEAALRAATSQQHQALAEAMARVLEFDGATPRIAADALWHALDTWS